MTIVAESVGPIDATLDPQAWLNKESSLLVWEAFVSGAAKDRSAPDPHIYDARVAVDEFNRRVQASNLYSDIVATSAVSIAGMALLASGLATDLKLLTMPTLVVKPDAPGTSTDGSPQPVNPHISHHGNGGRRELNHPE